VWETAGCQGGHNWEIPEALKEKIEKQEAQRRQREEGEEGEEW